MSKVSETEVEIASKAYADATGYYVEFHRGLSSPSADQIRKGVRAALEAAAHPNLALEALQAIADGEGDAQEIAWQTLEMLARMKALT